MIYENHLKEDFDNYADNYVTLSNQEENKRLLKQRNKAIKKVNKTLLKLKRCKNRIRFEPDIKMIEKKIIPYVERNKYLPNSYVDFLKEAERKIIASAPRV